MQLYWRTGLGALVLGWAVVASAQAPAPAPAESHGTGELGSTVSSFLASCPQRFADIDARIDKAGVRDAGFHRVPGWPFLRSDRLIASFSRELRNVDSISTWMLQMRENDTMAREFELANLGMSREELSLTVANLRTCATWMSGLDLVPDATLKLLIPSVDVPESYPELRRLQATPAGAKRLQQYDRQWRERVQASFAEPLSVDAGLQRWQAEQVGKPEDDVDLPREFRKAEKDDLGRIGLLFSHWRLLAEKYAPSFLMESAADFDQPATPVWRDGKVASDTATPTIYYLATHARVGGKTMIQLVYFVWFKGQDALGSPLDGMIWRVTLNEDSQPILYDAMSARGFNQLWFPTAPLVARSQGVTELDRPMIPQLAPADGDFAVRLHSGSHDVHRLVGNADLAAKEIPTRRYRLVEYENLMTLPAGEGKTRSLFGPDGAVPGSQAGVDPKLKALGMHNAGALQQWGQHAATLSGRRYYDDPLLIETTFSLGATTASR